MKGVMSACFKGVTIILKQWSESRKLWIKKIIIKKNNSIGSNCAKECRECPPVVTCSTTCLYLQDEKAVDGGVLPDANGKDPSPGGQTEGSKWQKPRLTRKSLMKCCLVKWIIASTKQQGPGNTHEGQHSNFPLLHAVLIHLSSCVIKILLSCYSPPPPLQSGIHRNTITQAHRNIHTHQSIQRPWATLEMPLLLLCVGGSGGEVKRADPSTGCTYMPSFPWFI